MSSKHLKLPLAAMTALSLLMTVPAGNAGGAMTIVPAPDSDVPHGDQIPAHRIQAIERQISEFNAATGAPESAVPRDQASTSH